MPQLAFGDVTTWFPGYGPLPIVGDCPHYTCMHLEQTVIGWGPDQIRYQAVACAVPLDEGGCDGTCRAMINVAGIGDWVFTGTAFKAVSGTVLK
jgi:hypothetical protein